MSARTVYADVQGKRLAAISHPESGVATVWLVRGPVLGYYNLDRFDGGKLTAKTLEKLFTPEKP